MKRIKEWFSKKLQQFKKSRFLLAVVMLAIGISYTVSYYEFKDLWTDYQSALKAYEEIKSVGVVGTPIAHAYSQEQQNERETDLGQNPSPAVDSMSVSEIVAKVRFFESSNGTKGLAVTCKEKGLSNDYGYNPPNCYKVGEDKKLAEKWYEEKLKVMSLEEANCLYTIGVKTTDCERNQNF